MSEHASGLATALGALAEVRLHAPAGAQGPEQPPYRLCRDLARDLDDNTALLGRHPVDCWLALSAQFAGLARHSPVPFFVYAHGNDFLRPNPNPGRSLESRMARLPALWRLAPRCAGHLYRLRRARLGARLRRTPAIFTNSRFTAELLARTHRVDPRKLRISHPGCADIFFADPRPRGPRPLHLLTVCRLDSSTRRKNVDGVLRALHAIGQRLDWRYAVVGDGDDRPRLQRLAASLGLTHRVRFWGEVSEAQLVDHYRYADLFVLAPRASTGDVEGFGMVYIEANAAGVPVLASRAGGAVEAVLPGVTGLLLSDSEPHTLAAGLETFARTRHQFEPDRMRAFAEGFRWPTVAARLLDQLQALLATPGARP